MKKILLVLFCLIFTSGLALAEHGTKKEKGYKAAGPKKTKGKNIYKSSHSFFYSACFPHYHPQIIDFITRKML